MKDFLKYLLSLIVNYPDEVGIEENQASENSFVYLIKANQEDIGKIIGKQGKIIAAIRNVAKVLAIKENKQIRIEIA
jgi:hypothetical protein